MTSIKYKYKGITLDSTVERFKEDGDDRYRIILPDGIVFVIAPSGITQQNTNIIWVQTITPGEKCMSDEMIQSIGEGIENKYVPTLGEEFLADFFDAMEIKHKPQVKITNLVGDDKQYRIADFYLSEYEIYVEFLGSWADQTRRAEYNKKRKVYEQNKISCVYIYPDNLGTIKYIFDKNIQIELAKRIDKKLLDRYRWFKFKKSDHLKFLSGGILFLSIGIPYKIYTINHFHFIDYILNSILFGILILFCSELRQFYLDIFKRNKYTLENFD
jgi:hypothetical protein